MDKCTAYERWISVLHGDAILRLSKKMAKNGQINAKWLFSFIAAQSRLTLWSKNWLKSKICQPLSLVSDF